LQATCNPEGAWEPGLKPKWRTEYTKSFSNKAVVLFEDNDAPGRKMAEHVSVQIHPVADSVRRIAFLSEREKFDVTNWVKAHDPEQLIADLERMIETGFTMETIGTIGSNSSR
jgi:hypothetical protein